MTAIPPYDAGDPRMSGRLDVVAAALLNSRAMRRGAPPISNVLDFAPRDIVESAREDARYVLERLDAWNESAGASPSTHKEQE